jgi:threonine aldolase
MTYIDLRSDTVTKPTADMKAAMFDAQVGDDVFGDDPTVNALEAKAAALFGKEAALFCASGTMTNQLAIKAHTTPGGEVICHEHSHVYLYEGGGIAQNSLASVALLQGNKGKLKAPQVEEAINNKEDVHRAVSQLVVLENTMNKGGGSIYDFQDILAIKKVCQNNKLALHLDGARLFNALVETPQTTNDYGNAFDSISICLSKGLGCPIGSLLIGDEAFIKKTRRYRKAMGGGWRQAGFLAAAGIFALDNHIERLKIDHQKAQFIGKALETLPFVEAIYPIETNIVIFELPKQVLATDFAQKMYEKGIGCVPFGKHLVRFVTHLDISDAQIEQLTDILKNTSVGR